MNLSPQQRAVVELIAQGHTDRGIAFTLSISRHTADFHVRCLFRKFGVNSRPALVLKYILSTAHPLRILVADDAPKNLV